MLLKVDVLGDSTQSYDGIHRAKEHDNALDRTLLVCFKM